MAIPPGIAPTETHVPFDMSDAASALIDATGTIIGWTPAAERLLGYPAAEVMKQPGRMLLAAPEDAVQAEAIGSWCRAHQGWGGLGRLRHRDGRRIEVGLRISAMCDAGDDGSWLVSGIDVGSIPTWALSGSLLQAFLTRSPVGMSVLSPDLRYVWSNDTLERYGGLPREERIGRRMADCLPGLDTEALEAQMRQVLRTGEPVIDYEYRGWTMAAPHREHAYSTSFFRLDNAEGRPVAVCNMVIDITDRWRARERLALLNEAGAHIGSTLDVMRTAQELADFAVPRLADFVTVDLLDSVLRGEEPLEAPGETLPTFRRAGQTSVREGCPESIAALGDTVAVSPTSPLACCFFSGEALLDPLMDRSMSTWSGEDPARAAKAREFGMRSLMVAPIGARGALLGVASFVRSRHPEPFEEDDLLLAEELVARAALNIDNARRFSREHAAALALQRSLLPHALSGGRAVEVASRYLPTDARNGVGGDWFDVIPLSGARVALVVGDVVGHGLNAAATMGRLRTAVHTLADMDLPPEELLAHLDDLVIRLTEEETGQEGVAAAVLGATCLYAIYDPVTQRCTMARAGHPTPAIVDPSGEVSFPALPAGPPLGLGSLPFESAELELPAGSLIALYTDGLIETCDQDIDIGLGRLSNALGQAVLPLEELCSTVIDTLLTCPQTDDVALLLARTRGLGTGHVASWDLPSDPAVVASARSLVIRQLAEWGLDELMTTTELIASELVTNAIRHGTGPIRLRLIRHDVLICEVADTSNTSPRLRHARTTDEGGRGLFLVAQLTRRWGTRYTEGGKLIWAEQDLPESA
ncbi:SpoIIE family protein phosphatase [Streptomyces sp. SID8382]|uniref:SpoIIE family protein phosphatase n=1 Tax=Streptomyces malaysiensis TaxID=92644 RepID=UPI000C2BD466|nr:MULTISPECIES: SpoIIE family protein phosphatase [unclassified Streptomyces]AUA15777.1 Phosphoserine phosphatase RsbU [Streptomyces sp. M56]MYX56508.1 SpoIIE family protein phosphatase [Streptomyces sp. SID8382]